MENSSYRSLSLEIVFTANSCFQVAR